MFEEYTTNQILTFVLVWGVISAMPAWWVIYIEGKRIMPDAERDKNFKPWVRHDVKNWSYL